MKSINDCIRYSKYIADEHGKPKLYTKKSSFFSSNQRAKKKGLPIKFNIDVLTGLPKAGSQENQIRSIIIFNLLMIFFS